MIRNKRSPKMTCWTDITLYWLTNTATSAGAAVIGRIAGGKEPWSSAFAVEDYGYLAAGGHNGIWGEGMRIGPPESLGHGRSYTNLMYFPRSRIRGGHFAAVGGSRNFFAAGSLRACVAGTLR